MSFNAVILAAGKSSRMGRDKAWLPIDGQPLLARQIQIARVAGATEVFISGRLDTDYSIFGCRVLHDRFPDAGPLAGIERALAVVHSPLLLALAVDLPNITARLLTLLHELSEGIGAVPKISGLVEPLAAFYPRVAAGLAEQQLQTGQNSVTAFAEACVRNGLAKFHELPPAVALEFANWNSPQDRTNALKVTDFQERTAAVSKTSRSVPQ